jgi:hypothetical protein
MTTLQKWYVKVWKRTQGIKSNFNSGILLTLLNETEKSQL